MAADEHLASDLKLDREQRRRANDLVEQIIDDPDTAAFEMIARRDNAARIVSIIAGAENRCMAVDGPVTNTRHEMTDDELRQIYVLAGGKIHE